MKIRKGNVRMRTLLRQKYITGRILTEVRIKYEKSEIILYCIIGRHTRFSVTADCERLAVMENEGLQVRSQFNMQSIFPYIHGLSIAHVEIQSIYVFFHRNPYFVPKVSWGRTY